MEKINLKGLNVEEIAAQLKTFNIPAFRAKQIFQWIYNKNISDFELMSNLSKDLRELLKNHFEVKSLKIEEKAVSKDGTIKYLYDLDDGGKIESVLLPPLSVNRVENRVEDDTIPNRLTICISTQVGCPLGCTFCATGYMKYKRNLSVYEIIDQILRTQNDSGKKITNIVFMGMGEPLLNYDNVVNGIDIINNEMGLGISNKHITVSTSGIVPGIKRLADENKKFRLAVSLHALNDEVRSKMMPINNKYNLNQLLESLNYYYQKTKSKITFEYILFDGINDTEKDIKNIIKLSKNLSCKFNMIQFHGSDIFSSELQRSRRFNDVISRLRNENVIVMARNSSGEDIAAACGQLAVKNKS